jgi:hypothetical protein
VGAVLHKFPSPALRGGSGWGPLKSPPKIPPGGPLLLDQLGCGLTKAYAAAMSDSVEEFLAQRAGDIPLQDLQYVLGQSPVARSGAPGQFAVEPVGHIAEREHLGHAISIANAWPAGNQPLISLRRFDGYPRGGGPSFRAA